MDFSEDHEPGYKTKKQRKREDYPREDAWARGQEAKAAELSRTQQALQLLVGGYDYPEIAETLGYASPDDAAADVHKALEEEFLNNARHSTEVLRMIELKRMNFLWSALRPGIERGNTRSAEVGVKVSDRISKMAGLDAPLRTEVVEMRAVDAEIERLKRQIAETKAAQLELESPVLDVEVDE